MKRLIVAAALISICQPALATPACWPSVKNCIQVPAWGVMKPGQKPRPGVE